MPTYAYELLIQSFQHSGRWKDFGNWEELHIGWQSRPVRWWIIYKKHKRQTFPTSKRLVPHDVSNYMVLDVRQNVIWNNHKYFWSAWRNSLFYHWPHIDAYGQVEMLKQWINPPTQKNRAHPCATQCSTGIGNKRINTTQVKGRIRTERWLERLIAKIATGRANHAKWFN